MPQLDSTWFASQLFWLVICFFCLYYIMAKSITPRIADILAKRKNKIDEYIDKATETKRKAEESLAKYNQALSKATSEADASLEKIKKELEIEVSRKQNALAKKLHKKVEEGEIKIQKNKEEALVKIRDISELLAKDIVHKIGLEIANENIKVAIKNRAKN